MKTNNSNKRLSGITGKIILLLISLILSLLLLESIIRVFNLAPYIIDNIGPFQFVENPKIIYEFIPGAYVDDSHINNQGFKDTEFIKEKPSNVIRIAMIGDSITQGMYVPLGETFSDQLEDLLNKKADKINSGLKYEVMNFGVGGYNLGAEVETLKTKAINYSPDIVILNFFHNDNEPLPGIHMIFMDKETLDDNQKLLLYKKYCLGRNSLWRKIEKKIFYKSKLYLFLIYRIGNLNINRFKPLTQHYNSIVKNNKNNVFYAGLSEIADLKKKYGFKFIICLHTDLLSGEHPNNKIFAETAKTFNFPYFSMLDYYQKENAYGKPLLLNIKGDTCHPNEFGNSIIAKAIFTELKNNSFINDKM